MPKLSLAFLLLIGHACLYADDTVMTSVRASKDFALTADPTSANWRKVKGVLASQDRDGKPLTSGQTNIRSRWTANNVYFLFSAPYERMYLRPEPSIKEETWGIWEFDVAEVFIGGDLEHINLYKEFEVSPRGEWIDLDVDRLRKGKEVDWKWNSGFHFQTRIDKEKKVWYCEMQIPWSSIDARPPREGKELRLNLYRIEGGPKDRKFITWRPVHNPSFHTPEAFGRLRLAGGK